MMSEPTQALILAAGSGSRLGELTRDRPKCLLDIAGGLTILEQQLASLRAHGTEDILVVAGFQWHAVENVLDQSELSNWRLIVNPRFSETDSLYSLWLAREWVRGPLLILNGDVVASPGVYEMLCQESDSNLLLYDSRSGQDPEHMKVAIDEGGCLAGLSKRLDKEKVRGESLGMIRLGKLEAAELFREADLLVRDGDLQSSAAKALAQLATQVRLHCHDIGSADWIEIDYPEDLHAAHTMKFLIEEV